MSKKRMAGQAISDEQLRALLLADKYQAPVGHQVLGERVFIDGDELIAMDENLGLTAIDTEPDVRELYLDMMRQGIDPGYQGAAQHGDGLSLNEIARLSDWPEYF